MINTILRQVHLNIVRDQKLQTHRVTPTDKYELANRGYLNYLPKSLEYDTLSLQTSLHVLQKCELHISIPSRQLT